MGNSSSSSTPTLAPGRQCGTCTLCCKLIAVLELDKPEQVWCPHCVKGEGCTIYAERPRVCRDWHCAWRSWSDVPEEWFPRRSGIVLRGDPGGITAFVDPGRPRAWRAEPFHGTLRRWAAPTADRGFQVVLVRVGQEAFAVLPDRDVALGPMGAGDRLDVRCDPGPAGPVYSARVARG